MSPNQKSLVKISELNEFLGKAALATYAGGGQEIFSKEEGFSELEYKEGEWYYKDSYAGFTQSWGREVVWYKGKPVWTQIYGGGMVASFWDKPDFAHETFAFLKKVLSSGEKKKVFQPRGPNAHKMDFWEYSCAWDGDITKFQGQEKILYKNNLVFSHHFSGGLILNIE